MRVLRLLPNVNDAATTATARATPAITERTGTADRPRPDWTAKRIPVAAETGSAATQLMNLGIPTRAFARARRRAAPCGALTKATTKANPQRIATRARIPNPIAVQSNEMPAAGSIECNGPKVIGD